MSAVQQRLAADLQAAGDTSKLLLIISVNLGNGNSADIEVHTDSEPQKLAETFCQAHDLGRELTQPIAQTIIDQTNARWRDLEQHYLAEDFRAQTKPVAARAAQTPRPESAPAGEPQQQNPGARTARGTGRKAKGKSVFNRLHDEASLRKDHLKQKREEAETIEKMKIEQMQVDKKAVLRQTLDSKAGKQSSSYTGSMKNPFVRLYKQGMKSKEELKQKNMNQLEEAETYLTTPSEIFVLNDKGQKIPEKRRGVREDAKVHGAHFQNICYRDFQTEFTQDAKQLAYKPDISDKAHERGEMNNQKSAYLRLAQVDKYKVYEDEEGNPIGWQKEFEKQRQKQEMHADNYMVTPSEMYMLDEHGNKQKVMEGGVWHGKYRMQETNDVSSLKYKPAISSQASRRRKMMGTVRQGIHVPNSTARRATDHDHDPYTDLYLDAERRRYKMEQMSQMLPEQYTFHPQIGVNKYTQRMDGTDEEFLDRMVNSKFRSEAEIARMRDEMFSQQYSRQQPSGHSGKQNDSFRPGSVGGGGDRGDVTAGGATNRGDGDVYTHLYETRHEYDNLKVALLKEDTERRKQLANRKYRSAASERLLKQREEERLHQIFVALDATGSGFVYPDKVEEMEFRYQYEHMRIESSLGPEGFTDHAPDPSQLQREAEEISRDIMPLMRQAAADAASKGHVARLTEAEFNSILSRHVRNHKTGPRPYLVATTHTNRRTAPPKDIEEDNECTFRPKINRASAEMAARRRTTEPVEDQLIQESKVWEENRRKKQEEVNQQELAECTFAPVLETARYYDQSSAVRPGQQSYKQKDDAGYSPYAQNQQQYLPSDPKPASATDASPGSRTPSGDEAFLQQIEQGVNDIRASQKAAASPVGYLSDDDDETGRAGQVSTSASAADAARRQARQDMDEILDEY